MDTAALWFLLFFYLLEGISSTRGMTCNFEQDFCGWTNDGWVRRKTSDYSQVSGPSSAADGEYYIQIDTTVLNKICLLKANLTNYSTKTCLTFRYHLYGPDVKYLSYGYISSSIKVQKVNITDKENYWHCATFDLSNIPQHVTQIYFEAKTGSSVFSVIGLDEFVIKSGSDCESLSCPAPVTIVTSSTTVINNVYNHTIGGARNSNKLPVIIGAVCGGVFLLIAVVIIFCIVRVMRNKKHPENLSSQERRPLPPVPCDLIDDILTNPLTIAESLNRKFSVKPDPKIETDSNANNTQESAGDLKIQETVFNNSSHVEEPGYIRLPPDYPMDDYEEPENSGLSDDSQMIHDNQYKNITDEEYLTPINLHATENQYESDPTEKRQTIDDGHECNAPNVKSPSIKIPEIPVMKNPSILQKSVDNTDEDYDDAIAAIYNPDDNVDASEESTNNNAKSGKVGCRQSTSENNAEVKASRTENDKDYLDVKNSLNYEDKNQMDYLDVANSIGGEDSEDNYLDMAQTNESNEDYLDVRDSHKNIDAQLDVAENKDDYLDMAENNDDYLDMAENNDDYLDMAENLNR